MWGLISGWAYKQNKKYMFRKNEINVFEKLIKANIPLHFKLHFNTSIVRHNKNGL